MNGFLYRMTYSIYRFDDEDYEHLTRVYLTAYSKSDLQRRINDFFNKTLKDNEFAEVHRIQDVSHRVD